MTALTRPERLDELYRDRAAAMVRLAHLLTGSNAVAQDVVQDAFVKIAPHLDRLDEPAAYLRVVVVNECRAWFRRRSTEERVLAAATDGVELPSELDEAWRSLLHVNDRERAALVLRIYEDLTFEQIAQVLDCPVSTAKSLVRRGLEKIREVMRDAERR